MRWILEDRPTQADGKPEALAKNEKMGREEIEREGHSSHFPRRSPQPFRHRPTLIAPKGVWTSESDYREAVQKIKSDKAKVVYISTHHWQAYFILSFFYSVSDEYAREKGIAFAERIGSEAYSAVFWGEGDVGGRLHIHVLSGGLWKGFMLPLQKALLIEKIAKSCWNPAHVEKAEPFDPRRGNLASYLPDHHEMEIIGTPKRYRVRRKRN